MLRFIVGKHNFFDGSHNFGELRDKLIVFVYSVDIECL